MSLNSFHIYLLLFQFIFSVFYHTRILPSFSIVLLFASESFFVFFFSIYLPVSFLVCSFLFFSICYNFLYFFLRYSSANYYYGTNLTKYTCNFRTVCYVRLCCCFLRLLLTKYLKEVKKLRKENFASL